MTLLQSERENCRVLLKYFRERLKIREIKDPRKFSAIWYGLGSVTSYEINSMLLAWANLMMVNRLPGKNRLGHCT